MMKKTIKQGSAVLFGTVLLASALLLPKAHAAIAVETNRDCSLQIDVPNEGFSELKVLPIDVNIYKVADIDVTGAYTVVETLNDFDLSDIDSETTAEEWGTKAELAKAAVEAAEMVPTVKAQILEGTVLVDNLETGMYLIDAQQVLSPYYQYDFTPYMISLPNNYFYSTGDDTWVYDLTGENAIGLKPEKTDRYGDLVIEKELDVYNATNEGATFVFKIEGTKTDVDTKETKVVYSNVVSMTFHQPGIDRLTIEDLPAGSNVTVTEVYTGASYKLTSAEDVNVIIIADGEEGAPVTARFNNTYDDGHNGGNGVVNSFIYNQEDGSWTHSATEDSTP